MQRPPGRLLGSGSTLVLEKAPFRATYVSSFRFFTGVVQKYSGKSRVAGPNRRLLRGNVIKKYYEPRGTFPFTNDRYIPYDAAKRGGARHPHALEFTPLTVWCDGSGALTWRRMCCRSSIALPIFETDRGTCRVIFFKRKSRCLSCPRPPGPLATSSWSL